MTHTDLQFIKYCHILLEIVMNNKQFCCLLDMLYHACKGIISFWGLVITSEQVLREQITKEAPTIFCILLVVISYACIFTVYPIIQFYEIR